MESIKRRVVRIVMGLSIESYKGLGMLSSEDQYVTTWRIDLQPYERRSYGVARRHVLCATRE